MSVIELASRRKKPQPKAEKLYECLKCQSLHFQIRESGSIACSTCSSLISNLMAISVMKPL